MSEKRDEILNVALNLFLQKTYKEVSIQEIVDKVGMTKGAFYYFFKSKEQIFLEVVNKFSVVSVMDFKKIKSNTLYEFYHNYVDILLDGRVRDGIIDKGNSNINFYFLIFDALKLFPEFREKMWKHEQFELYAWVEAISNAKKSGEIKSTLSDEQIAEIFIYTGDGIGMRKIMQGSVKDLKNAILTLWDSFYAFLKA